MASVVAPPPLAPTSTRIVLRVLCLAALFGLAFYLFGWLYPELLTIFAGVLLGVFVRGLALGIIRRTRWAYVSVVAALVILLLVLVVACGWLVGPALTGQIEQLLARIPVAIDQLRKDAEHVPFLRFGARSTPPASELLGYAATFVQAGLRFVAAAVLALVIGIYSAFDPEIYGRAFLALVPPARRERARDIVDTVSRALMRWIVGRVVIMIAVGVVTTLGLLIARTPVPFALGVLAGAMTFIPYLGTLLSLLPALLVALPGGWLAEVWVVVVFAIAHGLEGYVLAPLIAKKTVEFPPAFTISVQLVLGAVWGFLGFAFATPIAVVVTNLVRTLYVEDTIHAA